jgi:hypothetical protein
VIQNGTSDNAAPDNDSLSMSAHISGSRSL